MTTVGRAGGLGLLAGGYQSIDALAEQIAVRASSVPFGINLSAPTRVPAAAALLRTPSPPSPA